MSSFGSNTELLIALTRRELLSRYRGSYFGWLWALVRPLVMLGIYGLIIGVFLGAAQSVPDFMVFIFSGLIAWNLFTSIINGSISSVATSGSLITKASFPRILLPLASLITALIDTLFQFAVLLIGYALVRDWPTAESLAYMALALPTLVAFGLAFGLLLSAINVYLRDIGFLTDIGLQVIFWLCPVLYSYSLVERGAEKMGWPGEVIVNVYLLNPLAVIIPSFQKALWPPASSPSRSLLLLPPDLLTRLSIVFLSSCLFLGLAIWAFRRLSVNFAQEM